MNVVEGETPSTDEQMRLLERRANAYLPLAPLEAIGFDDALPTHDEAWWTAATSVAEITDPEVPSGPKDGFANAGAIAALERWFRDILSEAQA